jgi:tetratricopeptide (TPR) repeat protein
MKIIDPSYLRYIHDGLHSDKINKDNSTALPNGLVGMYEALFPADTSPKERERLLNFFGIWALLKKEVTTSFVAELLDNWTEEQVEDAIATYSKWFNSPEPGKYQLYHERFRVYLLQKMTQKQLLALNETIINCCKNALKKHDKSEAEVYALEHLSTNLYMHAMLKKEWGANLKELSYNKAHWNRQIEISKGFEWTKKMLNEMMLWAGKYDGEEVIECALNKLDVYNQEQNDAPRIVQLVADGDVETALQRIEAFGGDDKEGLKRKFILYMLCLMELTLLESKNQPFSKSAIEKLLKHLDEKISDMINWNKFFPSYLVFLMTFKWAELGLDYLVVYRKTNAWEKEWISEKGPYTDLQIGVILDSVFNTPWHEWSSSIVSDIAFEMAKIGKVEESLAIARGISDDNWKSKALKEIALELSKQGKVEESLAIARGISDESENSSSFEDIAIELSKQGKVEESLAIARGISDDYRKSLAFEDIAIELSKQGKVEESLAIARGISDDYRKSLVLKVIAVELSKQGKVEESASLMLESLAIARGITGESEKSRTFNDIAVELSKQGKKEDSTTVMQESLSIARGIIDDRQKSSALKDIAVVLSKLGQVEESLAIARGINDDLEKSSALIAIGSEFSKLGQPEKTLHLIKESLASAEKISDDSLKSSKIERITVILSKLGKFKDAFSTAVDIPFKIHKDRALKLIASELGLQGKLFDALDFADGIQVVEDKGSVLKYIAVELGKQGKLEEAFQEVLRLPSLEKIGVLKYIVIELSKQGMFKEALIYTAGISDNEEKSVALEYISIELSKYGKFEEAIATSFSIPNFDHKRNAIIGISLELVKVGKLEGLANLMQESIVLADYIPDDLYNSFTLVDIVVKLSKLGKFKEAYSCASKIHLRYCKNVSLKEIAVELSKQKEFLSIIDFVILITCKNDDWFECIALKEIAVELSKLKHLLASSTFFQKAITSADRIPDKKEKSNVLREIALEHIKLGQLEEAVLVFQKALASAKEISDKNENREVRELIAYELAILGKVEELELVIEEDMAFAEGITDKTKKSYALKNIAIKLSKLGQLDKSVSVLRDALKIADGIRIQSVKSRIKERIVVELAKLGKIDLALTSTVDSSSLMEIAILLGKQGQLIESLSIARCIRDDYWKIRALMSIATEMNQKGFLEESKSVIQESLSIAIFISDERIKNNALKNLSDELSKLGKPDESLSIAIGISNEREKSSALRKISNDLATKGKLDKSLTCAGLIIEKDDKSVALKDISTELSKLGNFSFAEQVGTGIPLIAERQSCWKSIAKSLKELHGWEKSLELRKEFKGKETIIYYLKGWSESISIEDISEDLMQKAIPVLKDDNDALEHLLQLYAINQLFFEELENDTINRYNQTLNIQWAIDIKNQMITHE